MKTIPMSPWLKAAPIAIMSWMLSLPDVTLAQTNRSSMKMNQLDVQIGVLTGSLSYARKIENKTWFFGGSAGFSWGELNLTSDGNDFSSVLHAELFSRYGGSKYIMADVGATLARYSPHDDDPRQGTLIGLYVAPVVGYRWIYLGTQVRAGWASDFTGSEWPSLSIRSCCT